MKKKIIVIVSLVIVLGICYFVFFNKKEIIKSEEYECSLIQGNNDNYTTEDNIYILFKNNELKGFTYRQLLNFNNREAYDNYDKVEPDWPSFLHKIEVDDEAMVVTYYRNIYFKYTQNSIDEYIKMVESKGYTCEKIENT